MTIHLPQTCEKLEIVIPERDPLSRPFHTESTHLSQAFLTLLTATLFKQHLGTTSRASFKCLVDYIFLDTLVNG